MTTSAKSRPQLIERSSARVAQHEIKVLQAQVWQVVYAGLIAQCVQGNQQCVLSDRNQRHGRRRRDLCTVVAGTSQVAVCPMRMSRSRTILACNAGAETIGPAFGDS